MKSQNNGGGKKAPIRHLSTPNEASSSRDRLHLIELLAKEAPWTPLNSQAIGCSPQNNAKTLLLKTTHTQLTEQRS